MENLTKTVSVIFHPIFIPLYCTIMLYTNTNVSTLYSVWGNIAFWGLIVIFSVILPSLLIWIRYKQGKISNLQLTERGERTAVYLQTITLLMICAYLLFMVFKAYTFVFFFVFAIFSLSFMTIVNMWWKISIHSCGMGILSGFVIFLSLLYDIPVIWWLSITIILSGLVMTSRCLLQAHTMGQTVAGFFTGLGFTMLPSLIFFVVI